MKNRRWLLFAVLTFILAVTWAVVTAVSSFRRDTTPPDVTQIAAPLNPDIDKSLFTILKSRQP